MSMFNENFPILIVIIVVNCLFACSQIIPFASEQHYSLMNKVTAVELYNLGKSNDLLESSYIFHSLLKVKSVWQSSKQQLIQVYLTDNSITTYDKKNKKITQNVEHIPSDRPFYVSLLDGTPHKVIAHTSRDQSLLNLKRGIASLFQNQRVTKSNSELDVSGNCHVNYQTNSTNHVQKIKSGCSNWDLKMFYRNEKPLDVQQFSQEIVEYEFSADGVLLKATSVESHRIGVPAKHNLGSVIKSHLILEHIGTEVEQVEQLEYNSLDEAIQGLLEWYRVFDIEADVDDAINEIKGITLKEKIELYSEELSNDAIGKESLAIVFTELLPLARITKKEEFQKILENNKSLQLQLVDLLGTVQTIDSHKAIHEVFQYSKEQDSYYLEKYLQSLAVATHPERFIVEDLFERLISKQTPIKNIKLLETVLQTLASLCRKFGFEKNDPLLKNIRTYILNELNDNCKNDESCKLRQLRALHNLQDPSTLDIIMSFAVLGNKTKLSVAAMTALKSFPASNFRKSHRRIFAHIFYQITGKYDSSVRTMALDILLNMKPTRDELIQLLIYLTSDDKHFEIKTYIIQKLKLLAERCKDFNNLLQSCLLEIPHVNNYHVLAQKGLTTVLLRDLSWSSGFNESILSVQEIYQGVLKRGSVEILFRADNEEINIFSIGMHSSGLTSLVGNTADDIPIDDGEDEDSTSTASMEIAVQGILLRPIVFFTGHTELMGHVWSGTASEPTTAYQATILVQDHEQFIILASGATIYIRVLGTNSINLYGKVNFSLWNRNANSEIVQDSGLAIHGFTKVGFTYAQVSSEFLLSYAPTLRVQADIDFYSEIKLCIQLQRPATDLRYTGKKSVTLNSSSNPYTKSETTKLITKISGRTIALNQKNNDMCNIIFA